MHEHLAHAAVREVHHRAREEGVAEAEAARARQHRKPQLGLRRIERDVHHREQAQVVVRDAEDLVAFEVDALVEAADGVVGKRRAEAQAAVVRVEGEEVRR